MTFMVEAEIPEGYEMTGELRYPEGGEWFLNSDGRPELTRECGYNLHRIILRPAPPKWRPATVKDLVPVQNGAKVKARFRDSLNQDWIESELTGYIKDSLYSWYKIGVVGYRICEVLDV